MKVCVETLGCKVNSYESEVIKNIFIKNDDQIVGLNESPEVIVINTCTVTNQSDSKSRKLIRQAKRINPRSILIVCGCSSQKHQHNMEELGIDILIGNQDKTYILTYLKEFLIQQNPITKFYNLNDATFEDMSINHFSGRTRAFVKIQDGCNNYCSYCIIPYVRGKIRNKDIDLAVSEVKELVKNGYKEVVLTGIHTGSYGYGSDYNLITLIKKISRIKDLIRIRISSIEITEINKAFLEELKRNPKICNHLHIPIQNGSDSVLKAMNRKYTLTEFKDMVNKIRTVRPDINLTTDLIVGFPTETDDNFIETINTVKEIGFSKIHVFPFSKRDGTAAASMKNIVKDSIKKERTQKLISISDELEQQYLAKFIKKDLEVLIEEVEGNYSIGHSDNYIKVYINKILPTNEIYKVVVTEIDKDYVKAV